MADDMLVPTTIAVAAAIANCHYKLYSISCALSRILIRPATYTLPPAAARPHVDWTFSPGRLQSGRLFVSAP